MRIVRRAVSACGLGRAGHTARAGAPGLLRCGLLAGPLFIATFLIEGAVREDYRPLRHPVSSLALGHRGWVQVANFSMAGALYGAFAAGLCRAQPRSAPTRLGPILVSSAALGLVGSAVFTTDPVSGYPPGTPDSPSAYSISGALHDLFAIPTFLGLPGAQFVYARSFRAHGHPAWARYSAASALAMLVSLAMANAAFNQAPKLVRLGGLFQRTSITIGFAWQTCLAAHTLHATANR